MNGNGILTKHKQYCIISQINFKVENCLFYVFITYILLEFPGGSLLKLVYLSKEDWVEPQNRKKV